MYVIQNTWIEPDDEELHEYFKNKKQEYLMLSGVYKYY